MPLVEAAVSRRPAHHPPGPRGWPLVGCLDPLLRNPMTFWRRIADRYGGIARVPLRGTAVYLVSDPTLLYELLITNRHKYRKNMRYRAAVELFGAGLLLNEGEDWRRQRLATQPAFKPDYVAAQVPWMAERTARHLDDLEAYARDGRACDVEAEFLRLAQLLAGYYLMGPAFARIAEPFCDAALRVKQAWPPPPRSVLRLLLRKTPGWTPRLASAIAALDDCMFRYLAAQRAEDFADSAVASLLVEASRADGEELDDQSLRDQLLTIFFAGHETSATSLCWIHYLLARHPDVRAKLRAEVDSVLGRERLPTAADLTKLRYTEQVVNEALRLYSPIHSISRVALEDDVLGGYQIPAGSTIYVSLYATHRLAQYWPDPDRFDPERFTPERNASRPRFAFIPFAAGHRNCIGGSAATTELKLVVAMLAQRFDLELVPGQRIVPAAGTTMHPRYGLQMNVAAA